MHQPGLDRDRLDEQAHSRQVRRVILIEGGANLLVLIAKLVVGVSTGSLAVLGDAIHSLTDIIHNGVSWMVIRIAGQPADREHPYGHRKFEMLAVFALATLLAVLAFELAIQAFRREPVQIGHDGWALGIMLAVLGVNVVIALWQRYWARRLLSDLLLADANHTFADVLTTVAVIGGWQLSVRGYPWLDTACALGVSLLVLRLAWGLFKRAAPVLIDRYAIEPELVIVATSEMRGVEGVERVRSRRVGTHLIVDMVIRVNPDMHTDKAHDIADAVERMLENRFQVTDVSIHIEPES